MPLPFTYLALALPAMLVLAALNVLCALAGIRGTAAANHEPKRCGATYGSCNFRIDGFSFAVLLIAVFLVPFFPLHRPGGRGLRRG